MPPYTEANYLNIYITHQTQENIKCTNREHHIKGDNNNMANKFIISFASVLIL